MVFVDFIKVKANVKRDFDIFNSFDSVKRIVTIMVAFINLFFAVIIITFIAIITAFITIITITVVACFTYTFTAFITDSMLVAIIFCISIAFSFLCMHPILQYSIQGPFLCVIL